MNNEKELILIDGEDKTEQIISCKYEDDRYNVIYKDDNEIYKYYFTAIEWIQNPVELNISETVLPSDILVSDVTKILKFGKYKKIFLNTEYSKVYNKNNISIDINSLNNKRTSNCFEYLKQLSNIIGVVDEENVTLLSKQYNITNGKDLKSILSLYLNPKRFKKMNLDEKIQPIFPFGFNLSQKAAIKKALTEKISIIEGPPGTGKTKTILNIIANAVIDGKTIAIVSNDNSTTSKVSELLEKQGLSFITASLGSNSKESFLGAQTGIYPDIDEWNMSLDDIGKVKKRIVSLNNKLDESLEIENRLANIKREIYDLSLEKTRFDNYYNEKYKEVTPYKSKRKFDSDSLMNMIVEYENMSEHATFINKISLFNRYKIHDLKFFNNSNDSILALLKKQYYQLKLEELELKKLYLDSKHGNVKFNTRMDEYIDSSMKLFKLYLCNRYNKTEREIFAEKDLVNSSEKFVVEYPVVLSTTHSLKNCLNENYLYDYVIIDESSQVDLVTGALALSCAKHVVIVGDLKQLPLVVTEDMKKSTDEIYNKYILKDEYKYSENSILSSVSKLFNDIPKTLLKEHYRCHPLIIGFCNEKFYNNELIVLSQNNETKQPLMIYRIAKGDTYQKQIDIIINDKNICTAEESIGIIYSDKDQVEQLNKLITGENIKVDTIYNFQGREKDIIIISNEFLNNPNLINVAVSRAKNKLILVVTENTKNTNIDDLIKYIEYNNFTLIESKVYPVFDILYTNYSNKLAEFNKKSNIDSENILNSLIDETLNKLEFSLLGKIMHQPLKELIKDTSKLTPEENKFAMKISTHTDFMIFNKLNKNPILVVEVEHNDKNKKQLISDNMKDTILNKCDLPVLRFKTNGSEEQEKLYNKLIEVLR